MLEVSGEDLLVIKGIIDINNDSVKNELSQYLIDLLSRCVNTIEKQQQENEQYKQEIAKLILTHPNAKVGDITTMAGVQDWKKFLAENKE